MVEHARFALLVLLAAVLSERPKSQDMTKENNRSMKQGEQM